MSCRTFAGVFWFAVLLSVANCLAEQVPLTVDQTLINDVLVQPVMLWDADVSKNGELLLTAGSDGCWVHQIKGGDGKLVYRLKQPRLVRQAAFSPTDHTLFATWSDNNKLQLWRVGAKGDPAPLWSLPLSDGYNQTLAFSPDGRLIALAVSQIGDESKISGNVVIVDVADHKVTKEIEITGATPTALAFSNDGKKLAIARQSKPSSIEVYDTSNWQRATSFEVPDGFPNEVAFVADSYNLLIAGGIFHGPDAKPQREPKVWTAKPENGTYQSELIFEDGAESIRKLAVEENGTFASATMEIQSFANAEGQITRQQVTTVVRYHDAAGEVEWIVDGNIGDPYGLKILPDGKSLVFCSENEVIFVDIETGEFIRRIAPEK